MTTRLEQIAEVLNRHKVEYLIMSGQAESLFGEEHIKRSRDSDSLAQLRAIRQVRQSGAVQPSPPPHPA
jgi:hypothetical protein